MKALSWNIQWGRGADGRADLARTIAILRDSGSPDVICLQEVARCWPGLKGQSLPEDAPARLIEALPGYQGVYFPCLERGDGRGGLVGFGNMILSRLPLGQVFRHLLPAPSDPAVPSMQRGCLEVQLETAAGPLRILSTHLEYYSKRQRLAQAEALCTLQQDALEEARLCGAGRRPRRESMFGLPPRCASALLCGDMNCEPDSAAHAAIVRGTTAAPGWLDAWQCRHPDLPHPPSVGLHGAEWPDRAYCCDYFFISGDLASKVENVRILADVDASDHQPVLLELAI